MGEAEVAPFHIIIAYVYLYINNNRNSCHLCHPHMARKYRHGPGWSDHHGGQRLLGHPPRPEKARKIGVPFAASGYAAPPSRPASASSGFILPCQPLLVDRPPAGSDWLHEVKHDGYRSSPAPRPRQRSRHARRIDAAPLRRWRSEKLGTYFLVPSFLTASARKLCSK